VRIERERGFCEKIEQGAERSRGRKILGFRIAKTQTGRNGNKRRVAKPSKISKKGLLDSKGSI